jgi:hypothetical protein
VLASNAEFVKFMKGLAILSTPVSSNGAVCSFATSGGKSEMVLYFHNQSEGDSLTFTIPIDASCARFNTFNHYGYADASNAFRQQVLNHDTALGKESLYLMATAGTRVKIRFPYLKDFAQGKKIAINTAQLFLYNADPTAKNLPPASLSLLTMDTAGTFATIKDYDGGTDYFGGVYDTASSGYFFRITRHMQHIVDTDTASNPDLYLLSYNPDKRILYPNQGVLKGTSASYPANGTQRMRLKVIYTILQ